MECSKLLQEKQLSRRPVCCALLRRVNYRTLVVVEAGNYGGNNWNVQIQGETT